MTAVIAPGLLPGLAPPATNAPPASAGPPAPGKTFAEAVAAVIAAAQQAGGTSNAPPGDPTAASTNPADAGDLMVLLAGLIARLQGGVAGAGNGEQQTPLPDRPAGAGVDETDATAMETLMAQLLLARTSPTDDPQAGLASGLAPVMSVAAASITSVNTGAGAQPGQALDGVQPIEAMADAVRGVTSAVAQPPTDLGGASLTLTSGATGAQTLVNVAVDAITAPQTPLQPVVEAQQPSTTTAPADQALAAATMVATAGGNGVDSGTAASTAEVEDRSAEGIAAMQATDSVAVTAATTDRPAPAVTAGHDRDGDRRASDATTTLSPLTSAPQTQGEAVARAAATARTEAPATAGPLTVQLANTVQSAVLRGAHEVRLVLNPPELGRVEINITDTPQGIRVHLQAEHAGARDLIERQLPMLHQALEARELRIERLHVSHAEQSSGAQWSLDSHGWRDGQREQRDESTPEWSPLAALGGGEPKLGPIVRRATAVPSGAIDVMA